MRLKLKQKAGKWSKSERKSILHAVKWGADVIGIAQEDIRLNVVLNNDSTVFGDAYYDEEETCTIRISSAYKKHNRALKTVFHELWHIHQYLKEGLDLGDKAYFKGKMYDTDYWDAPWEVAARKQEALLLSQYYDFIDR